MVKLCRGNVQIRLGERMEGFMGSSFCLKNALALLYCAALVTDCTCRILCCVHVARGGMCRSLVILIIIVRAIG